MPVGLCFKKSICNNTTQETRILTFSLCPKWCTFKNTVIIKSNADLAIQKGKKTNKWVMRHFIYFCLFFYLKQYLFIYKYQDNLTFGFFKIKSLFVAAGPQNAFFHCVHSFAKKLINYHIE